MILNLKRKPFTVALIFAIVISLSLPFVFTSAGTNDAQAENGEVIQTGNAIDSLPKKGAAAMTSEELSKYEHLFREFTEQYKMNGEYDTWSDVEKVKLANLMNELNLFDELDAALIADLKADGASRPKAADTLIRAFIGYAPVEIYTLMETVLGQIIFWPYSMKTLQTELESSVGIDVSEKEYLTPASTDVGANDAAQVAYDALVSRYGNASMKLPNTTLDASFIHMDTYGDEPVWFLFFRDKDAEGYAYQAVVSRTGEVLATASPGSELISMDYDVMKDTEQIQPKSHDATLEQALGGGLGLLTEVVGLTEADAKALTPKAQFVRSERFNDGLEPVWLIEYYRGDQLQYKALLGYDAKPIAVAPASEEFATMKRSDLYLFEYEIGFRDAYPPEKAEIFFTWTLEEKAEFSRVWKPIVDAYASSHPYFHGEGSVAYEASKYVYGLPGPSHVSETDALLKAKDAVVALGAKKDTLNEREVSTFFDITNSEKPIWKFTFSVVFSERGAGHDELYRVIIDATTGSVEDAFILTADYDPSQFNY